MNKESTIKPNVTLEQSELKKNIMRIVKGCTVAIILSLVMLLIYAIILVNTDVSESTIMPVVITITGMSILIGSTISTKKIKKNGLINGGIVGLVYIIFLYIVSSMCLVGFTPSMNSLIMLGVGIITGMVGRNNWSEFV